MSTLVDSVLLQFVNRVLMCRFFGDLVTVYQVVYNEGLGFRNHRVVRQNFFETK